MAIPGLFVGTQIITAAELNAGYGGRWSRVANQVVSTATLTSISWDTETTDTSGFLTPTSTTATIPTGYGGRYSITATLGGVTGGAGTIRITAGGVVYDAPASLFSGGATITVCAPLAAAATIVVACYQNSGSNSNVTGSFFIHRVGP